MSKVVRIAPEAVPEKTGDEMVVTLRVADVRAIIREEVKAALAGHNPPVAKILYPLKEAADMLFDKVRVVLYFMDNCDRRGITTGKGHVEDDAGSISHRAGTTRQHDSAGGAG